MAERILPTPEQLREFLRYEPETGKLFWKVRDRKWFVSSRGCNSFNSRDAGTEAFTSEAKSGYKNGRVLDVPLLAHRVIWAIHYGTWPSGALDHVNCNKTDNRI